MSGSEYILKLEEVTKENKKVGGKGANLGEMLHAGLPVPPGFVVSTDSYDRFIADNSIGGQMGQILGSTNVDDPKALRHASHEIGKLIIDATIPEGVAKAIKEAYDELSVGKEVKQMGGFVLDMIKSGRECFVAVRSSATAEDLATASFAGQMSTYLNIKGHARLLEAIKKCWASLFTPRAIFYRKTNKITKSISMGVIIQKMIDADKAGVIFTVDPTTNDMSKVMIEASWGLGETVVSGLVQPDEYIVDKESGTLLEKRVPNKKIMRIRSASGHTIEKETPQDLAEAQVLNDKEIAKLWELSKRTEDHYQGKPQDIEWCEEKGRLFLVQTRPVTTMTKALSAPEEFERPESPPILEGMGASPGIATGNVKIIVNLSDLEKMSKGDVLVARMTNPDFVPYMKVASAIVTDEGGKTSHASIVSRELGIPCIVGTQKATTVLKDNDPITVDAINGKVYSGIIKLKKAAAAPAFVPGEVFTATSIKVNLAFPETTEKVVARADGVGLLRAEHLLTEARKHPAYFARNDPEGLIQIIVDGVGKIAKAFSPKPVWYRTLDARTDEFRELEGGQEEPTEANPMLGWHGIRRSLDDPAVFRCEIEAIRRLHQSGWTNVEMMLPFIIKIDELKQAKAIIKEIAPEADIKVGIMVETPAAVMEIESFCKEGIAFASIGSNDLTQLVLGLDRGNTHISKLYSEMDPAVLAMIKHTVQTCKKYNVESSICGEAGSDPKMAEKLVEFGIESISCEMDAIDNIRAVVARTERKLVLDKIRSR